MMTMKMQAAISRNPSFPTPGHWRVQDYLEEMILRNQISTFNLCLMSIAF